MNDREKVIKGLEAHLGNKFPQCNKCPYFNFEDMKRYNDQNSCLLSMMTDAISMLKEQEPVLLENQHKPYGDFLNANAPWVSRCPKCGKKVEGKQTRFCKYCGQAVKWK